MESGCYGMEISMELIHASEQFPEFIRIAFNLIMPLSRAVFKGIARMATRAKWSLSPVMTASGCLTSFPSRYISTSFSIQKPYDLPFWAIQLKASFFPLDSHYSG